MKNKYWKTIEDYYGAPAVEKLRGEEFFARPEEFFDSIEKGGLTAKRRDVLKLGGLAMVFAAASCARKPIEKIMPYASAPEEVVPGVANWYASTCAACAAGCGILAKTREGRPIKLEGNPDHPLNKGKLCGRGQASLLDLYDPDRQRFPARLNGPEKEPVQMAYEGIEQAIAEAIKSAPDKAVLMTGPIHGPAKSKLIDDFLQAFPGLRHYVFNPLANDGLSEARHKCFGNRAMPRYRFDKAETIVILGADPLAGGHSDIEFAAGFGVGRKIHDDKMSKVFVFESRLSLVGGNADKRYQVRPGELISIALAIGNHIVNEKRLSDFAGNKNVQNALSDYSPGAVETRIGLPPGAIVETASALWESRGRGLVFAAGFENVNQAAESLLIAVNFLNVLFENEGSTIDTDISPSHQVQGSLSDMRKLLSEMNSGQVETIILSGVNPQYALPESFGFVGALAKVKTKLAITDRIDETASRCDYIAPTSHFLESWGDAEPQKGLYSLFQPTIQPIFETRSTEELLLAISKLSNKGPLAGSEISWHDYLKSTWQNTVYRKGNYPAAFEDFWNDVLRRGVLDTVDRNDEKSGGVKFNIAALNEIKRFDYATADLELLLYVTGIAYDGRHQNNPWLLETPDPVSKIPWDNYLSIAPKTAENLHLAEGDLITLGDTGTEIPVHIQPGHHPKVASIAVGWGRSRVGKMGNEIGVNAFRLALYENGLIAHSMIKAEIRKTGRQHALAGTQGHHYTEGRPIIYEATLAEFLKDPHAGQEGHDPAESETMWPRHKVEGHKWAMAIDLNSCIGCNACMVACQAENNIPVVGKDQILRGREMPWIRIDTYYSGEPDNPELVHQPMLCQHCENAPCETVCPVVATVHNDEGLNLQIYNRCVGTRYCANNCPYKVRRFNWHEYNKNIDHPRELVLNPDVTVREVGVMEKCTFCIQRIRDGKHQAKNRNRVVVDGDITPACVQTCPTNALVFGDLNDPESRVAKIARQARGYHVLGELNTRPSITYLTKIRNRNKTEKS